MLKLKTQHIPVLVQLQADGVMEGGMPGNGLFVLRFGFFDADEPPSCKKNIAKKPTAGNRR
jgi:hypothetical protein